MISAHASLSSPWRRPEHLVETSARIQPWYSRTTLFLSLCTNTFHTLMEAQLSSRRPCDISASATPSHCLCRYNIQIGAEDCDSGFSDINAQSEQIANVFGSSATIIGQPQHRTVTGRTSHNFTQRETIQWFNISRETPYNKDQALYIYAVVHACCDGVQRQNGDCQWWVHRLK